MVSPPAYPASRYRRRILGIGALLVGALYVIGAPIVNDRIEADLERRVPVELDAAGYDGVTAAFSGQDGTLTCRVPLDDPEAARAAAYDIWGVRAIDLDRSCRVNAVDPSAGADEEPTDTTPDRPGDGDGAEPTSTVAPPTSTTVAPPTTSESDLATVYDIVAANPDLAFLSVLLADTAIGRSEATVTLFAPSNRAFDAVPADVLGQLQNDADLLDDVLRHHAVEGMIPSDELVQGQLTALDGNPLDVVVGGVVTVGGAALAETDIIASNGVVHVIDAVILPPDMTFAPGDELEAARAIFDGTTLALSGVVASEVERQVVVEAAVAAAGLDNVSDEMTVDPDTGLDAASAEALATLVAAMPSNLLSGESGFDGTVLYATGIFGSDAGRDAFVAAAATVGVEASVTPPPEATDDEAGDLEAQLNAFVAENPILFQPTSSILDESALAIIDRLASDALQVAGVSITVEGHTDSDGVAAENVELSQARAEAVRSALVERGLDADRVEAIGFGSEQPVLVDGVEDKAASRRVEFRVVTT